MSHRQIDFYRAISEELDLEKMQRRFLLALLDLQHVERGSIWIRTAEGYRCVEAVGNQSERVKGIVVGADRPSIVGWVIENGRMTIGEPGRDARHFGEIEDKFEVKSTLILCFPLMLKNGGVYGAIQLIDTSTGGDRLNLGKEYLDLLQGLVDIGSLALSNSLVYKYQVEENLRLKQTIDAMRGGDSILGQSRLFRNVMKTAVEFAKTDFPVLITGESGTGKEVVAREVHRMSPRSDKPFLVQNCSAIPDSLLESELFGYRKGAFTGANKDKIGLFEAADGGTVFLDEIGDMPYQLQARLLRVLQNGEVKPLGGVRTRKVDVRIISATNRDMKDAISKNEFREDLFYRLDVLPIHILPLRERREDIPLLLEHFLRRECLRMGLPGKKIDRKAMERLLRYPWPGNVREMENFARHVILIAGGDTISEDDLSVHFGMERVEEDPGRSGGALPRRASGEEQDGLSLSDYTWEELEKAYVFSLLEKNRWHVTRAAKAAGVTRSTFNSRMKRLGIRR